MPTKGLGFFSSSKNFGTLFDVYIKIMTLHMAILIVCLRDIIKGKKWSKIDENLGYVSDPLNLRKFPLELIRNMKFKQLSAEGHSLPVVLNER